MEINNQIKKKYGHQPNLIVHAQSKLFCY